MTKINCQLCGGLTHSIQLHLAEAHPGMTLSEYQSLYPEAEVLSEMAKEQIQRKKNELERINMASSATVTSIVAHLAPEKVAMSKAFGLRKSKAALSSSGKEIMIESFRRSGEFADLIPDIDENYIYQIDLLKNVLMGLEENIPVLLWGHAGVGKSTLYEQVCARTNRPYMRVQHTANVEESHIVGQTLANEKGTYFEPGPLALAMKHGWVYNADEYDFAHASITAVYQPVLEGKSLVIKEAPPEWRVVKPHRNFRFVATGNTNGSGDESGLYSGTNMGNAANYSRFGITDHVQYMGKKQEAAVVAAQGDIDLDDAKLLVEFAGKIRDAFSSSQMSSTIGPRELIYAAKLGLRKGSWRRGVELAFINRMGLVDREVATGIAQRVFDETSTVTYSDEEEIES
ncbi:MAG: AAA family ATPase [Methylobacter sp.]